MHAVSPRAARARKAALVLLLASGCSLIKLDTNMTPLPKRDVEARLLTREFANGMVSQVVRTADDLAAGTEDAGVRIATIRWKLGASGAARRAALRTDPKLSLVDTWALACQMDAFFRTGAGRALFGDRQAEVTSMTGELARQITTFARSMNPTGDFASLERFVLDYVAKYPLGDLDFQREPIYPQWAAYRANVDTVSSTVGTAAEVVADVADRFTLYGDQLNDEVRWRLELLAANPKYDTADLRALAAHLDAELNRIAGVAERSPELARESIQNLRETVAPALVQLDQRWQDTLDTLAEERRAIAGEVTSQREAITATIKEERAAVMTEAGRIATDVTERALAQARAALRELLVGVAVIVLILLGVPFGLGFLAGRGFRRSAPRAERT